MALGRFPVSIQHYVAWGEMDAFGHVNNANYLRWFESARIAYFAKTGVSLGSADSSPWLPILGRASIDFRKPVTYPDTIEVAATVTRFGTTSFTMAYRATSPSLGVVAEGDTIIVLLDPKTNAKTPVPPELREAIEALEA